MATVATTDRISEGRIHARSTRDRDLLRAFLERDRILAAYALCDLDDREFGRTNWGVAFHGDEPVGVAMEYSGLAPQPLFVLGAPDGVSAVLREVIRPRVAWLAAQPVHLQAVEAIYRVDPGPPMVRMSVDRLTFRPHPGATARLLPAETRDLNQLYNLGFTSWLPSDAVATGVYYGVRVGGRLVAAAGTHVTSRDARLGVVGNVMTHRDHRNRGYAKMTTSAVTQELLRWCDHVVLNVRADNPPALAAYHALGYQEHARYEERLIHRRGTVWDSIVGPFRQFISRKQESQ